MTARRGLIGRNRHGTTIMGSAVLVRGRGGGHKNSLGQWRGKQHRHEKEQRHKRNVLFTHQVYCTKKFPFFQTTPCRSSRYAGRGGCGRFLGKIISAIKSIAKLSKVDAVIFSPGNMQHGMRLMVRHENFPACGCREAR